MIFCAVAGPTPGRASSWSALAVFRSSGAVGEGAPPLACAPCGPARGDEHLLAVRERRREVHERDVGLPGCAAGGRDRVRDPRPGGEVVEARPPDGAGDVDDELRG